MRKCYNSCVNQNQVFIPRLEIKTKINQLANQLAKDYENKELVLIGVMNGAFIFVSDLIRQLHEIKKEVTVDFTRVSSYGTNTESSKNPKLVYDVSESLEGKHILLVDDIIDTGWSLKFLQRHLEDKHPESLKTLVLLSKKGRREVEVPTDYIGFEIENKWVEGYGMDTDELGRGNPDIIIVEPH